MARDAAGWRESRVAGYSLVDVIGALGKPYPPRTADLGGTSKKPNPVYQPTDPPSPPLVTYSVTADDQHDFDSLSRSARFSAPTMHYSNDTPRVERKGTRKNTRILFLKGGGGGEER